MRCKGCDYPLWSIRARKCPECGAAFAPSEFQFAANAVEYRCPHCEQSYFGTDASGHLVPRTFDCVSCGQRIDMDEMVLFPGEGIREEQTTMPILPWLARDRKRSAAWRVIGMAMAQPRLMMDVTPVESSVGRAWWFYTLVMAIVGILSGSGLIFLGIGMRGGFAAALLIGLASVIVAIYGWALLWGAVSHGLMRVLGAEPRHTLGRTYQAVCYTSGVMMPAAIPCVGANLLPFVWIWWVIAAALAVPRAQEARPGRGAIAVVALPALSAIGLAAWITWLIVAGVSAVGSINMASMQARTVYASMQMHSASTPGGGWPDHGARLLADGSLSWQNLGGPTAMGGGSSQTIGGVQGWRWDAMSPEERTAKADELAAALPEGWAAHRLGHVVFTYNEIDPVMPQDPGLWLFLYWPRPGGGALWDPGEPVPVVQADGTVLEIDQPDFDALLESQNALRATHGLPALPHPGTVTEPAAPPPADEPAGAASGEE